MLQLAALLLIVSFGTAAYAERMVSFEMYVIGLACIAYLSLMRLLFRS